MEWFAQVASNNSISTSGIHVCLQLTGSTHAHLPTAHANEDARARTCQPFAQPSCKPLTAHGLGTPDLDCQIYLQPDMQHSHVLSPHDSYLTTGQDFEHHRIQHETVLKLPPQNRNVKLNLMKGQLNVFI